MQRDMSSHLDASFATRGAGQLVNEQVVAMREVRAGNMKPAAHGLPRDGRYTVKPMRSGGGMGRRMQRGSAFARARVPDLPVHAAPGMSGAEMLPGMGAVDLTLPVIGTVSWKSLALGAGVGLVLAGIWARKSKKRALASALAD